MQTNTNLDCAGLTKLIVHLFESGNPEVYLRHDVTGLKGGDFTSAGEVNAFIDAARKADNKLVGFAIWYPDTRGHLEKSSISLDKSEDKRRAVRHAVSGWGLIFLQLNFENAPLINCCVSTNSKKKAEKWFDSHRNLKDPDLWDWEAVEKHCRRLMHFAESLSQDHPVAKKKH